MSKYSDKIVEEICEFIKSDEFTIPEICKKVGISVSTYHKWKDEKVYFSDAIKKSQDERRLYFAAEAKKSLVKKIKGYDYEEVQTVYVNTGTKKLIIKERKVTKKHVAPDTAAIIFTLTNTDGENWKNRFEGKVEQQSKIEPVEFKVIEQKNT